MLCIYMPLDRRVCTLACKIGVGITRPLDFIFVLYPGHQELILLVAGQSPAQMAKGCKYRLSYSVHSSLI